MTTRELADAIDELIKIRIQIDAFPKPCRTDAEAYCCNDPAAAALPSGRQMYEDRMAPRELLDRLEVVKRAIADGFKDHSGAKGVFAGDSHTPDHPIHKEPKGGEVL